MYSAKIYDVLVVGAGVAGLAAGRVLAEAGKRVFLLEARNRVGGRIWSIPVPGSELPAELGAEFVHGRPPELLSLIQEAGLRIYELDGKQICFEQGRLQECSSDATSSLFEELSENGPDLSFAEWIEQKHIPGKAAQAAMNFVEGFNAADARRIGTAALAKQQKAEDAIEGDLAFRIEGGYSALPDFLLKRFEAAGGKIRLSAPVEAIVWQKDAVRVITQTDEFTARKCLVTLPLGVLQSGRVLFDPEPQDVMQAARRSAMGSARRITYLFREQFWKQNAVEMSFLFSDEGLPRVWWTPSPKTIPQITGWIGGPKALASEYSDDEQFAQSGLRLLAKMFSQTEDSLRALLAGWHTHDWQRDPFSLGAYSYAPKGAVDASEAMTMSLEETLYFAGEHTDTTGHWGTVHGALGSGQRAAKQILSAL